jgi:ABC-type multidrug transport system ATPase subunit
MKNSEFSIKIDKLGKKFRNEWIFRDFSYHFTNNISCAIIGPNGSGKSTLLQVISGAVPKNKGTFQYYENEKAINESSLPNYLNWVSPAQEIIEEFTLAETFRFHQKFKKFNFETENEFAERIQLEKHLNKPVKYFSSGMKQRVKLGLAFFSEHHFLFLDEPTTNLDTVGTNWYRTEIEKLLDSKIILISSNQIHEYDFCKTAINVVDFK